MIQMMHTKHGIKLFMHVHQTIISYSKTTT